ncbi:ATP-grasp domain-containing protein [Microtetraspora sp. NBRC 16547]|nr:ATP-grasp domain-containing protein [Microtetraspora sp. NBRC 16547]
MKIGRYPLHQGGVGAIRSLGRAGVPVYAVTEDRYTPAAASRHLTARIPWATSGTEPPARLVEKLLAIGRRLPRPVVAVATDDEAAVLLAEHRKTLEEHFLLPPVPPGLPRMLAGKEGLHDLCVAHGVPTPSSVRVTSRCQTARLAEAMTFPVVIKDCDPFVRLSAPAVRGSTVVRTPAELCAASEKWPESPNVLVQEYLPHERTTDWTSQICCDVDGEPVVVFTGVKVRSWPPRTGVTTFGYTAANPELAELTARFCRGIGYSGVASLDWRLDQRDGRYKLLDFNPRVGAQFRLFQTDRGVDLVRALHLTLTGRAGTVGTPVGGRRYVLEHLDAPALLSYRGRGRVGRPPSPARRGDLELAWFAPDDPVPALVMAARFAAPAANRLLHIAADAVGLRPRLARVRRLTESVAGRVTERLTDRRRTGT